MFVQLWMALGLAIQAAALGLSPHSQNMKLLASMDLEPNLMVKHGNSAHALAQQHALDKVNASYISVGVLL